MATHKGNRHVHEERKVKESDLKKLEEYRNEQQQKLEQYRKSMQESKVKIKQEQVMKKKADSQEFKKAFEEFNKKKISTMKS